MTHDKGLLSNLQLRHWIKAGTSMAKADCNGLTFTLAAAGMAAGSFAIGTAEGDVS